MLRARRASITTITRPLFELGHALAGRVDGKIAYIGVTEEDRAAGCDRRRGFEAGLRAAGNPLDATLIRLLVYARLGLWCGA